MLRDPRNASLMGGSVSANQHETIVRDEKNTLFEPLVTSPEYRGLGTVHASDIGCVTILNWLVKLTAQRQFICAGTLAA